MMIVRVNRRLPSRAGLRFAAGVLRRGGVIVYPTDTAYAIGGCFNRARVRRRVRAIKSRRDAKFTLVAASLAQVRKYFRLLPAAATIARRYWPGPVSIVVSPTFAVRVPASHVARALARRAGVPLIATSANRSGGVTPYTVAAVRRELTGRPRPDLVVDGGRLPKRKPSTIVAVDGRGKIIVIRAGTVTLPLPLRGYRVSIPAHSPLGKGENPQGRGKDKVPVQRLMPTCTGTNGDSMTAKSQAPNRG